MAAFKPFDVPEYLHCYPLEFVSCYENLPKNRPSIIADAIGVKSKEIVMLLIEKGHTLVANMVGGVTD